MRFVDPKNDVAFKKVFADEKHKKILISFLNAVLDLEFPIKEISIVRGDQIPQIEILKETSLDLKAVDEKNREFIIEMQVEDQKDFQNRSLYYATKSYAHQIKKADKYKELKPVIFLGILNFTLFKGEEFLTNHYIINKQTGNRDIEDLELNFIELPKFLKTEAECKTLSDKWIFFLKNADNLSIIPESVETVELKEAYCALEQFGWTKEELAIYDARSRFLASQMDAHETATTKGLKEGLKRGTEIGLKKGLKEGKNIGKQEGLKEGLQKGKNIGKQEGMKEGLQKGKEEGEKNKSIEIAKNLLDILDDETIALKTKLPLEDIKKLRK